MATGGMKNETSSWNNVEDVETCSCNSQKPDENKTHSKPVSHLRRALPQWLAAIAKNLLIVDLGMAIAFPTIVIPALLDAKEGLRFTESEASWFGSIVYLCQPLGSLLGAVTLEFLGRKKAMVVLNLPFFCCWLALYFSQTITILSGILGFTIGSMEAPILTYVGEISEPRLRGTLSSLAEIAEYVGFTFMFFLGTVTDWQTSALISALIPVISCIALLQVPETPIWLLSKGRSEESIKALCWLRGWVTPDQVQSEFDEIKRYTIASKMLNKLPKYNLGQSSTNKINISDRTERIHHIPNVTREGFTEVTLKYDNKNTVNPKTNMNQIASEIGRESLEAAVESRLLFKERIKDFCRREMMMPMFVVCSFFFFTYGSGMLAIRPYMVPVFKSLGFVMDPFLATTVFTAIGLGGCVICTVTVRFVGKRPLALISVLGCAISCFSLGTYALFVDELQAHAHPWLPVVMLVALAFFTGIGMDPLPWMYLGEMFPFRGRTLACGVAAAVSFGFGFIATKTFLVLEDLLLLSGVFYFYGSFGLVGFIFFYFYLPETEGRTMEDIEETYKKIIKNYKN